MADIAEPEELKKRFKPLGCCNYQPILLLHGSRKGMGDRYLQGKRENLGTKKTLGISQAVFVTEKLDGSNVGVVRTASENGGESTLTCITRVGILCKSSIYIQHQEFAKWVATPEVTERFMKVLKDGERLVGEWMWQAHGTKYDLPHEPFVAIDLIGADRVRPTYIELITRIGSLFTMPHILHIGPPISIEDVMSKLGEKGFHGAQELAEGAVWRIEIDGKYLYQAKYLRHEKKDGKYLPSLTGGEMVLNSWPKPETPKKKRVSRKKTPS